MRTKLMYALSALVMVASMLVTSCKENEEIQPEPPVNTYSVTFDANGGEGAMEKLSADEGESITLTANSFTREDYSFSGWNTKSDGTGTSYADKAKVTLSANLTLYAQWIENAATTYEVTFDANGGEGTMEKQVIEEDTETALYANAFTREDYSFSEWNTKADGTGTSYADKAKVALSANLALYAQWVADSKTIPVTGITLDKTTLTLKPTDFFDPLVATIAPADATNKNILWSSNNENVVCVDKSDGAIMTGDEGTATITATTEDGGFTATCEVTVEAPFTFADDAMIFVEGVSGAAPESYTLNLSLSATLYFAKYWNRERYDYPSAKWSSSDPSVVSVSKAIGENGSGALIKALKAGNSTITAEDSKGNKLTLDISVPARTNEKFVLPTGEEFTMIYVEGGTFEMGATPEQEDYADDDEFPVHSVTLSDFYMAEFEVTQELWAAVMGATHDDHEYFDYDGDLYPMNYITYSQSEEFASKLYDLLRDKLPQGFRFRLPTEAQWEYAARGGKKANNTLYAGSDYISEVAWYIDNSDRSYYVVGSKFPNELGIYDMSGNMLEWCVDWYSDSFYSISPENDPVNLHPNSARVARGGSYWRKASYCRVAGRNAFKPSSNGDDTGMRIALVQVQ